MSDVHRLINYFTQDDMVQIADMAMNDNVTFEELSEIMEFICDRDYYNTWRETSDKSIF